MKIEHSKFAVVPVDELSPEGVKLFEIEYTCIAEITGPGFYQKTELRKGTRIDFASIPKWLKWIFSDALTFGFAAAWHDAAYFNGVPKQIADGNFYELMALDNGIPAWQRWAAYLAVVFFGHAAYQAHRKAGHGK